MRKTVKARILAAVMAMAVSAAVMQPVYADGGDLVVPITMILSSQISVLLQNGTELISVN